LFNNFFANPGDDQKDIFNDSSGGTNKTNNSGANGSIQNIKQRPAGAGNLSGPNHVSSTSRNEEGDVFRNFSFYDSPIEENEILQ
jgi:hypothetical protein